MSQSNRMIPLLSEDKDKSNSGSNSKIQRRTSLRAINTSKFTLALNVVKSGQEAEQDSMEDFRLRMRKLMTSSTAGQFYENTILGLSVLSTLQFICQTYLQNESDSLSDPYNIFLDLEMVFGGIFFMDWVVNFLLADHRIKYITSFFSVVDILTVLSIFATQTDAIPTMEMGNNLRDIVLYFLFGCRRVRVLRALRSLSKLASIKDAVDRFLAEVALGATVVLLFFASVMQFLERQTLPYPYHTWMYYIFVTVSTVGYGDITPRTIVGRFAAMGMIGFALISVPKVTNELIEKMSLQSVYMRAEYTPKTRNSKHVVICGDLSSTSLTDLFGELFHEDHENAGLHAVILLPQAPTVEIILLMRDPQYFMSITYLEGSALLEKDLKRAKAESAQAMFIVTNKFSSNPDEEDAKSILLSMSIKRYIALFEHHELLYCMQLIRPENRRHLASGAAEEMEENDLVVCLNEIKMGTMAKAVMYPGANTLLMNLVSSFSDDAMDLGEADGTDFSEGPDGLNTNSQRAWLQEYQQGCGWEIYTTSLSVMFKGAKFSELSYALYDHIGVVLFALQITDRQTGASKLLLNPADFIIPDQQRFAIEAFVIAENQQSSDLSFSDAVLDENNATAMDRMRGLGTYAQKIMSSVTDYTTGDRRKSSAIKDSGKLNLLQFTPSLEKLRESAADDDNEGLEMSEKKEKPEKKKDSRWKLLKRSALLKKKVESYSYQEVLHRLEDEHFASSYYIVSRPRDLADCTVKTSVIEEIPYINNHTIIIGRGLRNLYDLIRPLRAKHIGPLRYIVILFPHDIPHEEWQRISTFDAILFVRGSALEESNLRRAGIFRAAQVVVLSDGTASNQQGMEALVDSDAIFSYQHVKRMNPSTQVVIEIVNQSNIAYLNDENSLPVEDHKFSPQFAAGCLFTTSLLDSIICQAYYNPKIIKVVNKLISGVDQVEHGDLAAKAADEVAHQNDNSDDEEEPDGVGRRPETLKGALSNLVGSCLYQVSLPDDLQQKTYGALFQYLAVRGSIPLGLLRGTFANMNMGPKANRMPYVFTNPSKDTELFTCDRVFILSKTPQRVHGKVDMKEWLLDIQMQKSREKAEGDAVNSSTGLPRSTNPVKGFEILEKNQKRMEERISKLSSDVNKKMTSLFALIEKLAEQRKASADLRAATPGSDNPPCSRGRLMSHDSLVSGEELAELAEMQQTRRSSLASPVEDSLLSDILDKTKHDKPNTEEKLESHDGASDDESCLRAGSADVLEVLMPVSPAPIAMRKNIGPSQRAPFVDVNYNISSSNSGKHSALSSGVVEEEIVALKSTTKPQASPKMSLVPRKVFNESTVAPPPSSPQVNNFLAANKIPSTIAGPSLSALTSQNIDRVSKIRAIRGQSMDGDRLSRPVSAGDDAYRFRSITVDETNHHVDDSELRKRTLSSN